MFNVWEWIYLLSWISVIKFYLYLLLSRPWIPQCCWKSSYIIRQRGRRCMTCLVLWNKLYEILTSISKATVNNFKLFFIHVLTRYLLEEVRIKENEAFEEGSIYFLPFEYPYFYVTLASTLNFVCTSKSRTNFYRSI